MVARYDLVDFASAARYERVNNKNHITIPASGIGNKQSISHNLGYVPFFKLFVKFPGRNFYEPVVFGPSEPDGYFDYQIITDVIDNNKIEVAYLNNTANPDTPINVYYRIYAEPQQ